MSSKTYARFVKSPRTISDLLVTEPYGEMHRFKISSAVVLKQIDYENFITDMLADREFLIRNPFSRIENDIWYCLFVTRGGADDGILVVPNRFHVNHAAYLTYDGNLNALLSLYKDPDRYLPREELEAMSSESLYAIVNDHMSLDYTSEEYTEYILLVMDVLEKREGPLPPEQV